MNARPILLALAAALLGLGLGYVLFSPRAGGGLGPAPADPIAAFHDALATPEPHARTRALLDFFATVDASWAPRLRSEVNQPGSKVQLDEIGEILFASWWARSDPAAAFANLVDPAWANRHPWVRYVTRAWAAADPAKAAEAVAGLPPHPDRGRMEAMRELVEHWWDGSQSNDVAPLLALIQEMPVTARAGAIERLLETSIDRVGLDETARFVESLPRPEAFGTSAEYELLARYGQILVERDVERARRFAEKHGRDDDGVGILRHMAFSWGVKDGPAAMEWAMGLDQLPERPSLIMRVWISFANAEPEKAAAWIEAREPDEVLEPVFRRYLSGIGGIDTQKALAIADRAKDAGRRERLLGAVGRGWIKADREAALEWLDSVELSPEIEQEVRATAPFDPSKHLQPVSPG